MEQGTYRKISTEKYVVAGIITVLIFSLGLAFGFILKNYQYDLIEEVNTEQEIKFLSLQLQYLYLTTYSNSSSNCPVLATTLQQTVRDLSDSLSEVMTYEEEKKISEGRKKLILRRYILDNLRYWTLARESKQKCHFQIVPILYFYTGECPSCPNQGTILTYFKKLFGEQVLVFPINLDLRSEEPMIEIVMGQFNVTKYPTLVIDNTKYEGVVRKDQLQEIICTSLQDAEPCSKKG